MKSSSSPGIDTAKATGPELRSTAADPLLGTQVGEFVIQERIGAGGMGVVYRAVHPLIGKQAAIKVMRLELVSPQQVQRLLVEARSVNAVRHQGIIDIFGFGILPDERPYVIMELLQGRPLSDFVRAQNRMPLESAVWVMDQMLAALGAAHAAGVVHRDLKPANVFVVESSGVPSVVKLVDFGIAKLLESCESPLTSEGSIIGTPEFMSPEQVRGSSVGPATDLYAVGVMLFQMLTGVRPFQGESLQVMFAHVNQPPPVPSSRIPGLPPELDALVLQLLEKDPGARPGSAEVVRERLKRIPLRAPPHAPSVPNRDAPPVDASVGVDTITAASQEGPTAPRGSRRHAAWVGGALVLLGLGAAVVWPTHQAPPTVVATQPVASIADRVELPAVVDAEPPTAPQAVAAAPAVEVASPITPSVAEAAPPMTPPAFSETSEPQGEPPSPAAPVLTKQAATEARPEAPEEKVPTAEPSGAAKFEAAQAKLTPILNRLKRQMKERWGTAPPKDLDAELTSAFAATARATTEKQCIHIEKQLKAWEKRFNQQLPPP
ncbi:serine/threonine protein kinase [Corallococcus sp. CA047B]|uniref:serine/threonine protein kinase n=1 Tax=Corallococcus sp. CA047B TaxID=2316729 RepID=UPI000EA13827|nr:serine/threonine-protein kinase [Corallococcus sp. CA047B]RKH17311.1 serine/threonine protein kinase [Corallococcus sp. CA047B]